MRVLLYNLRVKLEKGGKELNKNKTKKKKLTRLSKILIFILIFSGLIYLISISGLVNIKKIDIKTNGKKVSVQEIQELSNLDINTSMLSFNTHKIEDNILKNSYISKALVKRHFNGTVTIDVKERQIAYKINYAGGNILIDSEGYVLEIVAEETNYPVLLGITTDLASLTVGGSSDQIKKLNEKDVKKIEVINTLMEIAKKEGIFELITGADITDEKNYILHLDKEEKIVYLGDGSDLNTKLPCLVKILEDQKGIKGEIFMDNSLSVSKPRFRKSV